MSKITSPDAPDHVPYFYIVDLDSDHFPDENDPFTSDGTTVVKNYITDQWTHLGLDLHQGEILRKAKVVSRSKDVNSNIKGLHDPNNFLHSLSYDVEFPDGGINDLLDNIAAENKCAQADDDDGHAM